MPAIITIQFPQNQDVFYPLNLLHSHLVVSSQAHEQMEEVKLEAVQDNNMELVTEILGDISNLKVKDDSAAELSKILQEPHFQVKQQNRVANKQDL